MKNFTALNYDFDSLFYWSVGITQYEDLMKWKRTKAQNYVYHKAWGNGGNCFQREKEPRRAY